MKADETITSLDLGTNKVITLLGKKEEEIEIIGLSLLPSSGLKRGMISDQEKVSRVIEKAVSEAEKGLPLTAESLLVSISGTQIEGNKVSSRLDIADKKVSLEKIKEVETKAKASLPLGEREIIHSLTQTFRIDGEEVDQPEGIFGKELEADIFLITSKETGLKNLASCVKGAGFRLEGIAYSSLAASKAVLTLEDKDLGVVLLDVGAGNTNILLYEEDKLSDFWILPVGGDNVTRDLSFGLHAPFAEAERMKKEFGYALRSLVPDPNLKVSLLDSSGKTRNSVNLGKINEIIELRMREFFSLIKEVLEKRKYMVSSGIVLTGGGSLLRGSQELAEEIFQLPVRIGVPHSVKGEFRDTVSSPLYATAVGLLEIGFERKEGKRPSRSFFPKRLTRTFRKAKSFFSDYF